MTDSTNIPQEASDKLAISVLDWAQAAVEYIDLLQGELERSAGYLHVHGWTVPDKKVKRGAELRASLGIKGSGE